jgi:hypothetical protein
MMTSIKNIKITIAALGTVLLTHCGMFDDSVKNKKANPGPGEIHIMACSDSFSASQKAQADSLVRLANKNIVTSMEDMGDAMDRGDWDGARDNAPATADAYYSQALQIAPGHCGATFGKAMTGVMNVVEDPEMDEFVDRLDANSDDPLGIDQEAGASSFMTTDIQGASLALLKVKQNLASTDPFTISEIQDIAAEILLPRIDSTIARLEVVLNYPNFEFEMENEGEILQLDLGEIGPILAATYVFKSYLLVLVSHNLEIHNNGSYSWIQTISEINREDYDNLSTEQTEALDHITGFTSKNSSLTRVRPEYAAEYKKIPEYLLSAIEALQKGLSYGLTETAASQINDPYVVGTGRNADIDPADLQRGINDLNIFKKYLTGEVNISYLKGSKTIAVNFPKIFDVDGVQNYLPYHSFRPYDQWNDVFDSDTSWTNYLEYSYESQTEILKAIDYSERDWSINLTASNYDYYSEVEADYFIYDYNSDQNIAYINQTAPCTFSIEKLANRVPTNDPNHFYSEPTTQTLTASLETCRVVNGVESFVDWTDINYKSPLVFTNASGTVTFNPDTDEIDTPEDAKTKIIFPDPTFGGIFPELTQNTLWELIGDLDDIKVNTTQDCEWVYYDTQYYGYEEKICQDPVLPANPSDLDKLVYWMWFL